MSTSRKIGLTLCAFATVVSGPSTTAFATTAAGAGQNSATLDRSGVLVSNLNSDDATLVPTSNNRGAHGVNIVIDNVSASHEYSFTYDFPASYSMKLAYDGSVVVDDGSRAVAQIAVPWAKDARGVTVPTHFRIEGHTLVQVVDFTEGNAFPVVADPWYDPRTWNWSKIGHITADKLKKCGVGVIGGSAGAMGSSVAVNIVRNAAGKYLISTYGGPYGLIGVAAVSCVTAAMA